MGGLSPFVRGRVATGGMFDPRAPALRPVQRTRPAPPAGRGEPLRLPRDPAPTKQKGHSGLQAIWSPPLRSSQDACAPPPRFGPSKRPGLPPLPPGSRGTKTAPALGGDARARRLVSSPAGSPCLGEKSYAEITWQARWWGTTGPSTASTRIWRPQVP